MSSVLVVGGDQIDVVRQIVLSHGISEVHHWSGRKVNDRRKTIPHDTQLVVLMTKLVSHNITHKIKQDAAKIGIPVVYKTTGYENLHQSLNAQNFNTRSPT
jgi:hypothetical protein